MLTIEMSYFELLSNVILPAAVFLWLQIPLIGKGQNIKIESKVSAYGQSLTLICEIENCCNKSVAWEIWEPEFRTIFVDVRNVTFNVKAKYGSGARRNGYSLIIRNLSRYDINKFYSCTYGFKQSDKFILLEDAVFITDNANSTGGNDTWRTVAVVLAVITTACAAAAAWFIVRHRKRNNRGRQQREFDAVYQPLENKNKADTRKGEQLPNDSHKEELNFSCRRKDTSTADHGEREQLLNDDCDEMPPGDLATGLAWSHFIGYLSIILPELDAKIKECKWYKDHPGKMTTQFLILLPKSGVCFPLQDDGHITNVGHLNVEAQVAGTKRQYTPNVYCIKDERNQTSYFCCAEIPSAFGCIGKLCFQEPKQLSKEQRNLEVWRFNNILNLILSHKLNSVTYQKYKLIPFNDEQQCEEKHPSTHILRYFKEAQTTATDDIRSHKTVVCLLYSEADESHSNTVKGGLLTMPYPPKVIKVCPDQEDIREVTKAIKESRWVVLILSTHQKCFGDWLSDVLYSAIGVSVLPLLFNIEPKSIPTFLKDSKYIEAKDDDYLAQIYHIIQGQSASLETQCCVGKSVYKGLVSAFVVNYLNHVLPDITQRIEQRLEELSVNRCDTYTHYHRGLLEIVPMNCDVPAKLEGEWENCIIENKGRIGPTEEQQQQKIVRVFACNFYKLTKGDNSYYFAGEFVTPIRTLKGMRDSEVCGLTNDQMLEETKLFTKELEKIMRTEKEGRHCAIIRLQDNQSIPDLVIEAIQEDENTRHTNS